MKNAPGKLIDLLKTISWENKLSPYLLAGWCVVAPICHELEVFPNLILTGKPATGKTSLLDNVCDKLTKKFLLKAQGDIGMDSLHSILKNNCPITMMDDLANDTLIHVLALMRPDNKESAFFAKYNTSGKPDIVKINTSFISTSTEILSPQPYDGYIALQLLRSDQPNNFLSQLCSDLITPEFIDDFDIHRAFYADSIIDNIGVFKVACDKYIGGSQALIYAALLAGTYTLTIEEWPENIFVSAADAEKFLFAIN